MRRGTNESKLRWAREMRGYSQRTLAEAAGVSIRTLQALEQGARDINLANAILVYKLATALGVRMEELIEPEKEVAVCSD